MKLAAYRKQIGMSNQAFELYLRLSRKKAETSVLNRDTVLSLFEACHVLDVLSQSIAEGETRQRMLNVSRIIAHRLLVRAGISAADFQSVGSPFDYPMVCRSDDQKNENEIINKVTNE